MSEHTPTPRTPTPHARTTHPRTTHARTLHAQLHLLDRQVVRAGDDRLLCKVDDLELGADDHGTPYVTAILAGPLALGPRIGGVLGWLIVAVNGLFRREEDPQPYRIGMSLATEIGSAVRVSGELEELALERWLAENVVSRIPGAERVTSGPASRRAVEGGTEGREAGSPEAVRLSGLLGREVRDSSGDIVGRIADVRLVQDGPMLAAVQQAFRIDGFVVVPRHTGQLFGYERGPGGRGPAPVSALIRWLHRGSRYVTWDQVESLDGPVRLRVREGELAALADLYERDSR
ncbi:hypothetical protein N5079_25260 [Planotetraspora sp. A-T 1434]|uniref:hypothetical protein n=1 Tax=Planotetraspora sp. A-T 1434 TaxID=2979219 RepID=UPI0021BDFF6D|nr:hypothetical protein [Planotetraspora sp. A-T 1434]MCT9933527.1 hypothetical protein [Planotetraspora sp. A-T 1434]